jgi:tRNA threonylcarbamoyladenosine biosynthesis protein TsaE
MEVIFTLDNIALAANAIATITTTHKVIALHGDMGAGKTTLVHAVCELIGVKDNISSPTFSIINQYKTGNGQTIYHIDLYRLKDEEEAIQAGVEDCLFSGNICFVEWPQKFPGLFPEEVLHITVSVLSDSTRKINW